MKWLSIRCYGLTLFLSAVQCHCRLLASKLWFAYVWTHFSILFGIWMNALLGNLSYFIGCACEKSNLIVKVTFNVFKIKFLWANKNSSCTLQCNTLCCMFWTAYIAAVCWRCSLDTVICRAGVLFTIKIMELPCGAALFVLLTADCWGFGCSVWISNPCRSVPPWLKVQFPTADCVYKLKWSQTYES